MTYFSYNNTVSAYMVLYRQADVTNNAIAASTPTMAENSCTALSATAYPALN